MLVETFVPSLDQLNESIIEEMKVQVAEPLNDAFSNAGFYFVIDFTYTQKNKLVIGQGTHCQLTIQI